MPNEHTGSKWRYVVDTEKRQAIICPSDDPTRNAGYPIAVLEGPNFIDNARRIVACANALIKMDTFDIERGCAGDIRDT
jgi:hypothetical protein